MGYNSGFNFLAPSLNSPKGLNEVEKRRNGFIVYLEDVEHFRKRSFVIQSSDDFDTVKQRIQAQLSQFEISGMQITTIVSDNDSSLRDLLSIIECRR